MDPKIPERGRIPWVPALALLALTAGLAAWISLRRAAEPRAPGPPAPIGEPGEDVVDRALALAGDSTAIRARWVEDVRGVDLADLDPPRREILIRFANARSCTCGCGFTLAGCRSYDPTCEVSLPLARALVDSVRAGTLRDTRGLRPRPAGSAPSGG